MKITNHKKGIVLITSIFLVFLISTLGIGYLCLVNNQLESADIAVKSAKAFYCAESGISDIILYLKNQANWNTLTGVLVSGQLEGGSYKVEIDPNTPPGKDRIKVKSTGKISGFQRIIEVVLDKAVKPGEIVQTGWKET